MQSAIFATAYLLIALIIMGHVASKGIDEEGNVYDDSAVILAFALGLGWPFAIIGFVTQKLIIELGKQFN